MVGIENITSGIIFFHGESAAGKGDSTSKLKELAIAEKSKVIEISSGVLFRQVPAKIKSLIDAGRKDELSSEELEVADNMAKGVQIPTLQPIMPVVIDGISELIIDRLEHKNTRLVFDGVLRNGEDMHSGVRVPSQILQVSQGFVRAMKKVIKENPELIEKAIKEGMITSEVVDKFRQENPTDYLQLRDEGLVGAVSEGFRKDSTHVVLDILPQDAETLMRYRSYKTIRDRTFPKLKTLELQGVDKRASTLARDMKDIVLLQSGQFEFDGEKVILKPVDENDIGPRHFDMHDSVFVSAVDHKLREIAVSICDNLGVEIPKDVEKKAHLISFAFKKLDEESILPPDDLPRADDLSFGSRITRVDLYENVVKTKILEGELGIRVEHVTAEEGHARLNLEKTRTSRENVTLIVNGTMETRGISYPRFLHNAELASEQVLQRTSLEGVMNRTIEGAVKAKEK